MNSGIRTLRMGMITTALMALSACGGGSGGGGAGGGALSTLTRGNVTSVNGSSINVGGVTVSVPSLQKTTVSAPDGSFNLGALPPVVLSMTAQAQGGSSSDVTVDLTRGGSAVIRMSIDGNSISRVSVERCDGFEGENETRAALTPIVSGLKGHVDIRARANGDMKLEVEAEHLAAGQQVEFLITDAGSTTVSLGVVSADTFGEAELEIETENGGVLPFGASSVVELEGFTVVVRDVTTSNDLLTGAVPVLGHIPSECTGNDDSHDDDDDDSHTDGRNRLTNASGVAGEADVELESRPDRNEEEFEVKVEFTNVAGTMVVYLEDPSNAGSMVNIGALTLDSDGDLELEFETDEGDTLPFGVSSVSELVGLSIEIRKQSDDSVVYSGVTPPMNAS